MQSLVFLTYFFSKVIEEKTLGGRLDPTPLPPLVKERLNLTSNVVKIEYKLQQIYEKPMHFQNFVCYFNPFQTTKMLSENATSNRWEWI